MWAKNDKALEACKRAEAEKPLNDWAVVIPALVVGGGIYVTTFVMYLMLNQPIELLFGGFLLAVVVVKLVLKAPNALVRWVNARRVRAYRDAGEVFDGPSQTMLDLWNDALKKAGIREGDALGDPLQQYELFYKLRDHDEVLGRKEKAKDAPSAEDRARLTEAVAGLMHMIAGELAAKGDFLEQEGQRVEVISRDDVGNQVDRLIARIDGER